MMMLGPFTIDTMFPAFTALQDQYEVDPGATQQLVSAYLVAFAAMSLFYGPLSDALGRKPVLLVSLAVYVAASAAAMLAPSFAVLVICRCFQGLSAGGASVISRAIVRDIYDGAQAQRVMSHIMMIFGIAPAIAPVLGGWILLTGPWPLIFGFLAVYGLVMLGCVSWGLPETHPAQRRVPLNVSQIRQDLSGIASSVQFMRLALAASCAFGGVFVYISSAALIVTTVWGLGDQDFWKVFVPLIGAMSLGSWISGLAAGRVSQPKLIGWSLYTAAALSVVTLGFVSVADGLHPLAMMVGPALIALSNAVGAPSLQLRMLDLFPQSRGSAASASMFVTLVLNSAVAGLVAPHAGKSMTGLATVSAALMVTGSAVWCWSRMSYAGPTKT